MREPLRVALAFALDFPGRPLGELLRGVRAHGEGAGGWELVLVPEGGALPAGCQGVIARGGAAIAATCERAGVPFVFVSGLAKRRRVPRVVPALHRAGRRAARLLVECGYESLSCVGFRRELDAWHLREGFLEAGRGHVTRIYTHLLGYRRHFHSALRGPKLTAALDRWLRESLKPAGVFACTDMLARFVANRCVELGLDIPDEVGIVGAGNDPDLCATLRPALTSIDFRWEEVGARAAAELARLLDGGRPLGRPIYVPPRIVPRRSTDRGIVHDELVGAAMRYIASHSHHPLRPEQVARAVGVSRTTLWRRFRRFRLHTIKHEITSARLRRALDLLATTAYSIEEVAQRSGFGTGAQLRRIFRQRFSRSPGEFRRDEVVTRDA